MVRASLTFAAYHDDALSIPGIGDLRSYGRSNDVWRESRSSHG
jgi:hypothetical protein